jgi:hypothetical protein
MGDLLNECITGALFLIGSLSRLYRRSMVLRASGLFSNPFCGSQISDTTAVNSSLGCSALALTGGLAVATLLKRSESLFLRYLG